MTTSDARLDIHYRVIQKAEIPSFQYSKGRRDGEWVALATLAKMLAPSEAIELNIPSSQYASTTISGLHSAASVVGVKLSTMRTGKVIYIVKVRDVEPTLRRKMAGKTFTCRHCERTLKQSSPSQRYCGREDCQRAKKREFSREYRRKKAGK